MSSSSNTSQFVKTYGKPRRTQGLGHESLWHADLADSFDKCLGIEDIQQTTFISPESVGSVTMYKPAKYTKVENKMKTINGWSEQLHSTLSGHKTNSNMEKRNIEHSFKNNYRKKLLLKSVEKKKTNNCLRNIDSSCSSKPNMNSKVALAPAKKSKKIFMLSKEQCSTPFQRSIIRASRSNSSNMSSNKWKSKNNIKINVASAIDVSYSSELLKVPDCSLKKINGKYIHLDQSVQISGCRLLKPLNREPCSKNKNTKNAFMNHQKTNHKPVLNKHSISRRYKKKNIPCHFSNEKNFNWYDKIINKFCVEESNFSPKSFNKDYSNEKILTLEESLENYNTESVIICHKNKNVVAELSEQQIQLSLCTSSKNESFQSLKHTDKSLSVEELDSHVNFTKSNEYIVRDNKDIRDGIFEKSRVSVLSNNDFSKVYDNSLYLSCCQFENKVIKSTECSNICVSDDDINVDHISFNPNKPNTDYEQNQFETPSSCNNSTCMISNRVFVSSAESLDLKLPNISKRDDSNSSVDCVNRNEILPVLVENISFQSNNKQLVCNDSKSQILEDITNTFSNFSIDGQTESFDQFIFEESIFEESDKSVNFSVNNSTFKHITNNSSSNLYYNSSSSKQKTIIYKRNDRDSLKCKDEYDDSEEIVSDQTLHDQSQDGFHTICRPIICRSIMENKCINSDSSYTVMKNKFQPDCDRTSSLFNRSDISIENISSIEYEGETVYENQTDFENIFPVEYKEMTISEDQTDFEKIFPVEYREITISEDQTNISNSDFNDTSETSRRSNLSKNVSRRKRYAGRFQNCFQVDSHEKSADETNYEVQKLSLRNEDITQSIWSQQQNILAIHLEPGKKWRRSILILRNFIDGHLDQSTDFAQSTTKGRKWASTVDDILRQQSINTTTIHQTLDQSNIERNLTCRRFSQTNSAEKEIVRKYIFDQCKQEKPLSFESWLEPMNKKKWKKIGEGVYGEVFSYTHYKDNVVVKVIPVEGESYINSERQKMMFEVYSEIFIIAELNKLFDDHSWNQTNSFCKLKSISCVRGKYPKRLIKLWKQYNEDKGSDNDNPNILPDNQMFMILEMEDGGIDVESFVFNSAYQALFAFLQTVFGLAVAEQQFDFEHRDLHIGNILVKKILTRKTISYKLDGETFTLPSHGVKITIIDFTLSRMSHFNKSVYNDLANDAELFTANGDYQFEVYRLMREETNNQWDLYKPKTNIYWLHYVLDKMLTSVHYKNTATAVHNTGLRNLDKMKNTILSFSSAKSFAESDVVLKFLK